MDELKHILKDIDDMIQSGELNHRALNRAYSLKKRIEWVIKESGPLESKESEGAK